MPGCRQCDNRERGVTRSGPFSEPYFARTEIWSAVGNYSDSLQDYLTGIQYARQANRDLLSYSIYFDKLVNVA